jgi:hypothetical protein
MKKQKLTSAFSSNAAGELDVLRHDGDTLGMNGAEIGILEKTHEVRLRCLLKGKYGSRLEAQVRLEVLSNFADEALEWQFPD